MLPPHSVLIPVANPETASQYIYLGARIAEKQGSILMLLHVEHPSSQHSSEETSKSKGQAHATLAQARSHAAPYDVPVQMASRAAPNVAEGIIRASQDPDVGYLIMGWRGDIPGGETMIGSNIDDMVRESNSHTIVMQRDVPREGERLLVPVANPHAARAGASYSVLLTPAPQRSGIDAERPGRFVQRFGGRYDAANMRLFQLGQARHRAHLRRGLRS